MIQVSNEFKNAIKKPERKIKGYVEVVYDVKEPNITYYEYFPSSTTFITKTVDGKRVENLYGSLDYLPLDGSILTMQPNLNQDSGYISDTVFEEIETPILKYTFDSETINGLTLYFRTNIPTNLTINYSDGTSDTITNDRETIQIIFNEPKTLTYVEIIFNEMMYSDRKIYVNEIDFGLSQVYKDQDLIEFTVDEEVNKLVEEVPINETNIILNNMNDLFNPLNPKGIVPYLSEETLIKPYIGVLTENLGIEYVKMGEFYFDSYTNNSDSTTTLVGKNIINNMNNELLQQQYQRPEYLQDEYLSSTLVQRIFDNYYDGTKNKYQTNILNNRSGEKISLLMATKTNLLDTMKDIAFLSTMIFYGDRDNKINMKLIDNLIKENISKTELINDAEYKKIEKINCIEKKLYNGSKSTSLSGDSAIVYTGTIKLKSNSDIVLIELNQNCNYYNLTLTQSGGTSAYIFDANRKMCFVQINGVAGNVVEITIKSDTSYTDNYIETVDDRSGSKKNTLKIDYYLYYGDGIYDGDYYIYRGRLFDIAPNYEMSFEYNGDPSLEAGDYINVETPYGYKPLFIQKNRFKFDGGLEGSIEGVE